MSRRRKAVVALVGAVVMALVLIVALFDWGWFRGPIERLASSQLERRIEIRGGIGVELGLTPRFAFEDVRLANAEWGSRPEMLTVEHAVVEVDLRELLAGRVVLPMVAVRGPDVLVERDEDGRLNWQIGDEEEPPADLPAIGQVTIEDARVRYRGPEVEREVVATLEELRGTGGLGSSSMELRGSGALEDLPLALDLEAGALEQIRGGEPYPIDLALELDESALSVRGTLQEPLELAAVDLRIRLESPDPSPLLAAVGLDEGPVPPASLSGRLLHEGQAWRVEDLAARVGESTLSGRAGIELGQEMPLIEADLRSEHLDLHALARLYRRFAPTPEDVPTEEALWTPEQGLNPDLLPDLEIDLRLEATDVVAPELALQELRLEATLRDNLPALQFSARGRYQGEPLRAQANAGAAASDAPYEVDAEVEVGPNRSRLSGRMSEPLALQDLVAEFELASPRPRTLLALMGLPTLDAPAIEASAQLTRKGPLWDLENLAARLGDSDLEGKASIDFESEPPALRTDLRSERIEIADLRPLWGPGAQTVAEEAIDELPITDVPGDDDRPLFSEAGLDPDALPELDAEVAYAVQRLTGADFQLENTRFDGHLKDRVPALSLTGAGEAVGELLTFDVRLGSLENGATEEGYPIEAHVDGDETLIEITGFLAEPVRFRETRLQFQVRSSDPGRWLALAALPAPEIPRVHGFGELVREDDQWRLPEIYLEVGESNLFGTASLDLSRSRPLLNAELESNRILVGDFLIQMAEEAEEEAREAALISSRGVNLEVLPDVDVDLALRAEYVQLEEDMLLDRLSADVQLRDRVAMLDLSGEGRSGLHPFLFEASIGSEESLSDLNVRLPIEARLEMEATRAEVSGSMGALLDFADLDLDVVLEGPDLGQLDGVLRLGLPNTPPYRLTAGVTHNGARWRLDAIDGRVGDSDLQGEAAVDLSGARPMVVGEIRSRRLDLDDLARPLGAPPEAAALEAAEPNVPPDEELDLPDLQMFDARVQYVAEIVQAQHLPIEHMSLDARLEEGLLTIDPLRIGLAEGTVDTVINLDAHDDAIRAALDLRVQDVKLESLLRRLDVDLPEIEPEEIGRGTIAGRAKLDTRGKAAAEMAGALEGQLVLLMDGGLINATLIEGAGLDIGEILALIFTGGNEADMVPIRCLVADVPVSEGVARLDSVVLDTTDSKILAYGGVDFGAGTLDVWIATHPKDVSPLSANVPVHISGSFDDVSIQLVTEDLPEAGIMDLGEEADADCDALMARARRNLEQAAEQRPESPTEAE